MIKLKNAALLRDACLVNGRWVKAADGHTVKVENPARLMIIGDVPSLSADEVRAAVEAAGKAFSDWSRRAAKDRAAILRRWFDLMVANADDLGALMTAEQGKPFAEARGEAVYAA
ncbi:aldehyde dehydrogenase family protein, partial [Agrobacterium sp. MS2]|uniref:aldehyde dehydrogenase family protein n=1 Tax=Agrobacterium sp. MS2 TaxID=1345498 RepID=UPI000DC0340B